MYYLLRERNIEEAIPSSSIVQFDTPLKSSETNSLAPSEEDIQYQDNDGSINFVRPGVYVILWYIAGMTGFATNGQSYKLRQLDYSTGFWTDLSTATNHIKVSSSPGYSVVDISEDEITQYGKATIALFNSADSTVELTFFSPKAVILIFGLDLALIAQDISHIITEINRIEQFIYISEVITINTLTPALQGIGVSILRVGFEHEFWGVGSLDQEYTLVNNITYYILTVAQYPPLALYVLEPTVTTLWIDTGATLYSFPVRFDGTGIYFIPRSQIKFPAGTTFKFTQTLLLIDPGETPHLLTASYRPPAVIQ